MKEDINYISVSTDEFKVIVTHYRGRFNVKCYLLLLTGDDEEIANQQGQKKGKRQRKRIVELEETVVGKRCQGLHVLKVTGECKSCRRYFIRRGKHLCDAVNVSL